MSGQMRWQMVVLFGFLFAAASAGVGSLIGVEVERDRADELQEKLVELQGLIEVCEARVEVNLGYGPIAIAYDWMTEEHKTRIVEIIVSGEHEHEHR